MYRSCIHPSNNCPCSNNWCISLVLFPVTIYSTDFKFSSLRPWQLVAKRGLWWHRPMRHRHIGVHPVALSPSRPLHIGPSVGISGRFSAFARLSRIVPAFNWHPTSWKSAFFRWWSPTSSSPSRNPRHSCPHPVVRLNGIRLCSLPRLSSSPLSMPSGFGRVWKTNAMARPSLDGTVTEASRTTLF